MRQYESQSMYAMHADRYVHMSMQCLVQLPSPVTTLPLHLCEWWAMPLCQETRVSNGACLYAAMYSHPPDAMRGVMLTVLACM